MADYVVIAGALGHDSNGNVVSVSIWSDQLGGEKDALAFAQQQLQAQGYTLLNMSNMAVPNSAATKAEVGSRSEKGYEIIDTTAKGEPVVVADVHCIVRSVQKNTARDGSGEVTRTPKFMLFPEMVQHPGGLFGQYALAQTWLNTDEQVKAFEDGLRVGGVNIDSIEDLPLFNGKGHMRTYGIVEDFEFVLDSPIQAVFVEENYTKQDGGTGKRLRFVRWSSNPKPDFGNND